MNTIFRPQDKAILLILIGMIGTMFLWAGGMGAGRYFSNLPTNIPLMITVSILGLLFVGFVSSYAATHVSRDE